MRALHTMILIGLFFNVQTAAAEAPSEKVVVTSKSRMPKKPDLEFKSVPFQLDTLMFTFPSGLRVMFQQDNTLPVVAVTTVFDVGASDDPVTEAGMAHVLEHSWFLSTQEGNTKIWTMQQSDMGCNLNAYTNYDNTVYMSVCPSREMQRLLRLSSKLVLDPIKGVTSEQLTNELEVVRNEIRMRTENGNMPFFPILEFINKHTYGESHQYYKPMAGDHETVRNITLDKVESWVTEHYRPDNATIMVVGDFDASDPRDAMTWVLNNLDPKMIHPDLTEDQLAYAPERGSREPRPRQPRALVDCRHGPQEPQTTPRRCGSGRAACEKYAVCGHPGTRTRHERVWSLRINCERSVGCSDLAPTAQGAGARRPDAYVGHDHEHRHKRCQRISIQSYYGHRLQHQVVAGVQPNFRKVRLYDGVCCNLEECGQAS